MIKRLLTLLFIAFSLSSVCQQQAQWSMYRFCGLFINPGYTGSHDVLNATAVYRHQWVKMPGQPASAGVNIHSPLNKERIALGLQYTNDRLGVSSTNSLSASFAYRLPVGKRKKIKLSFGLSAGFVHYSNKLSNVIVRDADDADFSSGNVNRWLPQVGFGFYAYSDRFFAGFSVPQILAPKTDGSFSAFSLSNNEARQYHQLLFTAGYVFYLGKKARFIPSGLLRIIPSHAPVSFDLNATFVIVDRVWLGAGYRYVDSYNFMAAVNITKQVKIGYCYDLTVSPLSKYTTGSHEVLLSFDCRFDKGRIVNPRYMKYF